MPIFLQCVQESGDGGINELIIIWLLKPVHPSENNKEPVRFFFPFFLGTWDLLPKHVLEMVIKIIHPCVQERYNSGGNTVLISQHPQCCCDSMVSSLQMFTVSYHFGILTMFNT